MKELWFLHNLLGGMASQEDKKLLGHAKGTAILVPELQRNSQTTQSFKVQNKI